MMALALDIVGHIARTSFSNLVRFFVEEPQKVRSEIICFPGRTIADRYWYVGQFNYESE